MKTNNIGTCPICENETNHTAYTSLYGTEDEYIGCSRCGYFYEFSYGGHREYVAGKEFIWNYLTYRNKTKMSMISKKIKKSTFMAIRNWKKYKKTNRWFYV